jgi:diguanylate cyclase (GGDEF)-like protein
MARSRSLTPVPPSPVPLAAGVLLPIALVAALIVAAVLLVSAGAGKSAANAELDARAVTVSKAWQMAGRPTRDAQMIDLGRRVDARLSIGPRKPAAAPKTSGDFRSYRFAVRGGRTLSVVLPVAKSKDELSNGFTTAVIAGVAGVLLLVILGFVLLRARAIAPLRAAVATLSQVKAHAAQLEQVVGTDPVTGLASGPRIQHATDIEVRRAAREQSPMALVLMDIDNFKVVNDAHGKQAGDNLLRAIAERVKPTLRATDILGRVGGDDFAILLPKATSDHAEMIISRTRGALADLEVPGFTLTLSAGYACYPSDARDAPTLMQAAEGALKMARRKGSAATCRFDPAEVSVGHTEGERHEVVSIIDTPGGITPVFQPLVALATGQISGFEALTRFQAPPKRRPDEWFLLAQRVGLGPALEARAIQAALDVRGRPAGTYLSLNLSPSTLTTPEVQAVLPRDLTGLVIEVTEHELAADDTLLSADLAALRDRGALVAVDDAGAGYAGLQQLMRVQPDLIKLDRSLVQDVDTDPAKQALVDSFVRFARRTGAQVVAEGIETEEELRALADLDVNYGQGYFLAKPGPPWPTVSPFVGEKLLRRSLAGAMAVEDLDQLPLGSDQRLAAVCSRIARVSSLAELQRLEPVIAAEMAADDVVFYTRANGGLVATGSRQWLPAGGRLDLAHFPELEGVLRSGEPEQVLLERGSGTTTGIGAIALLANSGYRSMLAVPIGGNAMLQAFCEPERPWGRAQTNRALVIAFQLAPVLAALAAPQPASA